MPVLRTCRKCCGMSDFKQRLESANHITNAALPSEVGGIAKRIKTTRRFTAKNQSSEIRLSESANKKIPQFLLHWQMRWFMSATIGASKRRDMPSACFVANGKLSTHWKHAKGMSLRYGVIVLGDLT